MCADSTAATPGGIAPSPRLTEVRGVRSGQHCVPPSLQPKLEPRAAVRPYRVERPVVTVASPLGKGAIGRLTAAYLDAPDVAASYFVFLRDVEYVVDFGAVGMTLRATSVAHGVLRDGGYLPPTGMPQYGAVLRRLIIARPPPGQHRPTRWERGYGAVMQPGCWSGDLSPTRWYAISICERGMAVVPHKAGPALVDGVPPLGCLGDILGRVTIELPEGGSVPSGRKMAYICY